MRTYISIALVCVGLLISDAVFAQRSWTQLEQPYGGSVYTFIQLNDRIVAGSEETDMMVSSDNGLTWESFSPNTRGRFPIAMDSEGHLYAVSDDVGGLYRTSDNGQTWENPVAGLGGSMQILVIDPSDNLFAQTSEGIWRSTDDGGSWVNVEQEENFEGWTTIGPDGTLFLFKDESDARLYRSTDAGDSWEVIHEAVARPAFAFDDAGGFYMTTQEEVVYSSDNGDSFESFALNGYGFLSPFGMTLDSEGRLWVLTYAEGLVRVSSDGSVVESLGSPRGFPFSVFITEDGGCLLGYNGLGVWRLGPDGEPWVQTGVRAGARIVSLAELSAETMIANVDNHLFLSEDEGQSWTNVPLPADDILFVGTNALGTAVAATDDGVVYSTTDNGMSWQGSSLDGSSFVQTGYVSANGTMMLSSLIGGLLRSTDGGSSWTEDEDVLVVDDFAESADGTLWTVSAFLVSRSTDDGATWEDIQSLTESMNRIEVLPDGSLVAFGSNALALSTDEGQTWAVQDSPCDLFNGVLGIDRNGNPYIAGNCGIYKSTNGGKDWSLFSENPAAPYDMTDMLFASGDRLFLATEDGIYVTSNLSSVRNRKERSDLFSLEIVPNVARTGTALQLEMIRAGMVKVTVTDLDGARVYSLPPEYVPAGRNSVSLEFPQSIPSGTYVVRCETGNESIENRMILIR